MSTRLSIGVELLACPSVLLADEPTTGLDSTNAVEVVDILARTSAAGVNVILSLHQPRPDILRLLNRLTLLSGSGTLLYNGPTAAISNHLRLWGIPLPPRATNLADYLLDVIIGADAEAVDAMVARFAASETCALERRHVARLAASPAPLPPARTCAPFGAQFGALSRRLLRNTYRHPFLVTLNLLATLATALALGAAFWDTGTDTPGIQNRFGSLFFMLLFLSLMSLSSLPIWKDSMLLLFRERDAGLYSTTSYFASCVLYDVLPLRVLPPLFFAVFTYWMIGLHSGCAACLLWFVLILVLGNVAATSMCMLLGVVLPSLCMANMVRGSRGCGAGTRWRSDTTHGAGGVLLSGVPVSCAWQREGVGVA